MSSLYSLYPIILLFPQTPIFLLEIFHTSHMTARWTITKRHGRFAISLMTVGCGLAEIGLLVKGDVDLNLRGAYGGTYLYLYIFCGTTVLFTTIVGCLNFYMRRWLRFQVLFESCWISCISVVQMTSLVVTVVHQIDEHCPARLNSASVPCRYNAVLIILGSIATLCNFIQAILLIRFLMRASFIRETSIKSIILTDTRHLARTRHGGEMPGLPLPTYSGRQRTRDENSASFDWLEVDVYSPIRSKQTRARESLGGSHFNQYLNRLATSIKTPTSAASDQVMLPPLPPRGAIVARHYERREYTPSRPRRTRAV